MMFVRDIWLVRIFRLSRLGIFKPGLGGQRLLEVVQTGAFEEIAGEIFFAEGIRYIKFRLRLFQEPGRRALVIREITQKLFLEIESKRLHVINRLRAYERTLPHNTREFRKRIIIRMLVRPGAQMIAVSHGFHLRPVTGLLQLYLPLPVQCGQKVTVNGYAISASLPVLLPRPVRARTSTHPDRPAPVLAWLPLTLGR